ncbi:MAG: JAB domain-containing protein [Acutalibacteraceae bacterium]|jgi:DNA repair protein RadC
MADKPIHEGHRQRLKQRFLREGLAGFERHQVVEMLLFFGIPRVDTNELAHRLLDAFGSLSGIMDAPYDELIKVKGVTENAAVLICFSKALGTEYARDRQRHAVVLKSAQRMGEYAASFFVGLDHEAVLLVCMDNRFRVLHSGILTHGSVNAAEINTRLILQTALRHNATAIMLAHNHPGGSPVPSYEDVTTTRYLREALNPVHITLIDHFIVAEEGYTSMRNTPTWSPIFE